jgi:CHAT domain-containing protein
MQMSTPARIQATENPTHSFTLPSSNIAKAVEDAQRSLSMHEAAGDKIAEVIGHAGLAMLYAQGGDFAKTSEQRSLAERMAREINDPKLQAEVVSSSAAAHVSLGEFDEAVEAYQGAMSIFRSIGDEKSQAEAYASVGWVNESLGKIPDAFRCYDAALNIFHKLRDRDGEVRILMGIGSLYQSIGEFERAVTAYRKAIFADASKAQQARILASTGDMNLSRNSPSIALRQFEMAFSLIQDPDPAIADAVAAEISIHMLLNHDPIGSKPPNSVERSKMYQREISLFQHPDPALEGSILAGMGRCHMLLDYDPNGSKPLDLLERARTKMVEAGNRAGEAGVLATIGELHYSIAIHGGISHFAHALDNYNNALALMRQTGDRAGEIGVLANIGLVFDAKEKYKDALNYYRQALDLMDQMQTAARIEEFRINIANQSASLYQRAILLEASLHHPEKAFNLSERARARSFLDQLGNRRIHVSLPGDFIQTEQELRKQNISLQRRIGQELSKPAPDVDEGKLLALESQQREVQRQYLERVRTLRIQNSEYASFLNIAPLTLREVQQQIPSDVTAVSYFTTPSATLVFVLTNKSFHVSELPIDEASLDWTIRRFLDFSGENEIQDSLESLRKALIAPIKSHLKTSTLAIVPYGALNDLPFAALTEDGQHYLGDKFAVFSLPSLSVLPYIKGRKKSAAGTAMVVANDWQEGLPFLGNAYGEAHDVASILASEPLLGDDATVSSFQKRAGDSEIIHLIAHIDHDKKNPEISRVVLGHGKDDEGALELDQVLGLDLKKTNLVVLSGCQSQGGKRSRNDDIVGLTRAFIYAGSPSVIASLWSVDDEATRALMVSFYTHLKQGLGKAEALRTAQSDVRQKYPSPYYWAGFVLTGDPGSDRTGDVVAQTKN